MTPQTFAAIASAVGLSGIASLLTFFFAGRRDRSQRTLQIELSRLEELRSVVSGFVATEVSLRAIRKARNGVPGEFTFNKADPYDSGELRKYRIDLFHRFRDLTFDRERLFRQTIMLVALSYDDKRSDALLGSMQGSDIDAVTASGAAYLQAEWTRILAGHEPRIRPK